MTNADAIRAMTDDELAEYLSADCPPNGLLIDCRELRSCQECWLKYLHQEAKDEK